MRKFALFIVLILLGISAFFLIRSKPVKHAPKQAVSSASTSSNDSDSQLQAKEYLFVPFWTIDQDISQSQDNLICFGITGGKDGINTDNDDFKNLQKFKDNTNNKPYFLTVRLLDTDTNNKILKDKSIQQKIITDTVTIAKQYNFSGVVLDLETQGLPFQNLIDSITNFNTLFAKKAHDEGLIYATLLYGDTLFRARPYDIGQIGKTSDMVMVMAYDLSKSKGDPGPNFPLRGKDTYGYDLNTMVSDFSKQIPKNKLVIMFGMYGYDWTVDEQGRGKGTANSKTTLQDEKFITQCISDNSCKVTSEAGDGTKITYTNGGEDHVMWFEDYDSVKAKKEYLSSIGVNAVGYWAYSYY